ncbi:hypothetical protein [Streptomyces sp. NBC_00859]|uniref:hypothetical protein n=1 Tax=Streptomyces sp. NBC_00859 TaxID=2903682 RepID=UPI003869C89B|nr:hypothetical protein OG584_20310 [Streptomyces sp. NBC_00859]
MSRVQRLTEIVLADLRAQRPDLDPSVDFTPSGLIPGAVDVLLGDRLEGGFGCGFLVNPENSDQEIVLELAFRIPTAYAELFQVGIPVVPGSQRTAVAVIEDDAVVWRDPKEPADWSCPVGRLGPSGR